MNFNGYNNNFNGNNGNFNNFDNNGFPSNPNNFAPVTAESILNEINNAIVLMQTGGTGDPFYVQRVIDQMIMQGKIVKVGGGSNRICIELLANDYELRTRLGMTAPIAEKVIYMIPAYKIVDGTKDNKREDAMWRKIQFSGNDNSQEMSLLRNLALPSKMIPGTFILMQERVVKIEEATVIQAAMRSGKYRDDEIGKACRDLILDNPSVYAQYAALMRAMDKYFIMADLNPEFSPFNFGFKSRGGQSYLTILDYGYVAERIGAGPVCPNCGRPLHYIIPKEEWLRPDLPLEQNPLSTIATAVEQFGYYSCKNPSCKGGTANGSAMRNTVPYYEKDIDVFLKYTSGR